MENTTQNQENSNRPVSQYEKNLEILKKTIQDTEKDKDTDHISYNTVGEEEYRNAYNILYNKRYQLERDLNGDSITALEQSAAENVIAVHIRHIREKIEINPKEPKYLKVIWGIGYKVEAL